VRHDSPFLPYGRQLLDDADITGVVEALGSDYLTTGPRVEQFEKALAEYCGVKHAVVVCNGTAALHLAVLAAGLKPGDRVLTSANTFLASANCAEFAGATADFADIDPHTYNITSDTLQAAWRDDVRAVVPVAFAGQPCNMRAIAEFARSRGAIVIEDACHAIGSELQHAGQTYKVGGHPWADMTVFSFHPVKTITTGEGGAIVTDKDNYAERCRLFRNHGMVKDPSQYRSTDLCPLTSEKGPWYYEMQELGYNYRITDLQCALGHSQLKKLGGFIQRRAEIVATYNAAFASLSYVTPPYSPASPKPAWHLYVLQFDFTKLGKTRTQVMTELRQRGVGTQVHYIPVHLQPYYRRKYGYAPGKCPVAEAYFQHCLSLPLYPAMTDADVQSVITAIRHLTPTNDTPLPMQRI
jgi:UDP-4-amino-4,6-dideoxy-N-acetyl-beta-L-altrosamine transaminase